MISLDRALWVALALGLGATAFACSGPPPDAGSEAANDLGTETDAPDIHTTSDLGTDSEAGVELEADAAPCPDTSVEPALRLGHRYELSMAGGGDAVSGELIATYDERRWWTPGDDTLLALFDPAAFPERPEDWATDRSIRFVALDEVAAITELPPKTPTFAEFARERRLWPAVPLAGPSYVMAGHERHHLAENGFGDFAYDLGRADEAGRWRGDGLDLSDYLSWDAPILAPRGGLVVELVDEHPDRPIDTSATDPARLIDLPENLVGLWLTGRYYLYLLHLREGSIPPGLAVGDLVTPGTPLGRIGNSGTSFEPHLHMALLYYDSERERSFSIPLAFTGVFVSTRPTGGQPYDDATPLGGTWIANTPF